MKKFMTDLKVFTSFDLVRRISKSERHKILEFVIHSVRFAMIPMLCAKNFLETGS